MSSKNAVKIVITANARQAKAAFRAAEASAKKSMAAISAASVAAGGSLALLGKGVVETSSKFENYGVRLRAVLGSTEQGNQLFQDMVQFAGKVPFAFNDIMASATSLAGIMQGGVSEVNRWMPMIADLAAVSGLSIQQTTAQVVRMYSAGAASADLFRERGITAMLGFKAGVSVSAEDTRKQLIAAFEDPQSKFRGASVEMAKTWDGLMSMMGDKWTLFQKDIGDAGLFTYFKALAKTINDELGGSLDDQHDLAKKLSDSLIQYTESAALGLASVVDAMSGPMDVASKSANQIWDGFNKLPTWAQEVGVFGAIIGGKKGVLLVGAVSALGNAASRTGALMGLVAAGQVDFWDAARMNAEEADATLAKFDQHMKDLGVTAGSAGGGSPLIDGTSAGDSSRAKVKAFFDEIHQTMKDMNATQNKGGIKPVKTGAPSAAPTGASPEVDRAMQDAQQIIDIHSAKFKRIQILGQAAFADETDRLLAKQDAEFVAMDMEQARFEAALEAQGANKQQLDDLDAYYQQLKIDRAQQTADQMLQIDAKNGAAQAAIQKDVSSRIAAIKQQEVATLSAIASTIAPMITKNAKAQMAIQAALAMGETFVNYQVAVARTFAELGPIAGAPVAAAQETAMGVSMALIAAKAALQIGGGGSTQRTAPSFSGGSFSATSASGLPQQPAQQQSQNVVVNLHPQFLDPSQVTPEAMQMMADSLAAPLNDAFGRGQHLAVQGA